MAFISKEQVLSILTVEEWMKFKAFSEKRPQTPNGYDTVDLHEFLGVMRCEKLS